SLSTYNSVRFTYASRSDVVPTYQAGSLQQTTVLLTHIKTYSGSSVVFDYQLTYQAGTTTVHSYLTSLNQCDASGACLAPTTCGWKGSQDSLTMTETDEPLIQCRDPPAMAKMWVGDYNGDGLTDAAVNAAGLFATCPDGQGSLWMGANDGSFTP